MTRQKVSGPVGPEAMEAIPDEHTNHWNGANRREWQSCRLAILRETGMGNGLSITERSDSGCELERNWK